MTMVMVKMVIMTTTMTMMKTMVKTMVMMIDCENFLIMPKNSDMHALREIFILKHCDSQPWMMVIPKMLNINVKRHSGKKS